MSPLLLLLLAGGAAVALSSSGGKKKPPSSKGGSGGQNLRLNATRASLGPDYVKARAVMENMAESEGLGPDPEDWIRMQYAAAKQIDPNYDWPQSTQDARLYDLELKKWDPAHLEIWQALVTIAWDITGYSIDTSLQ